MTMYVGLTMFWSILAGNLVVVNVGRKRGFWSILTKKLGFDRENGVWSILPKKLVVDRKNWIWSILAEQSGFGRFWPKKVGLVDFDRENWFWTEKTGFG